MQGHSEIGERILANVDDYGDIATWCATTMSGSTAMAIPTVSADEIPLCHGSSLSRTPTTP